MMSGRSGGRDAEGEWEVRPGGMLVQRRDGEAPGPAIRIRVSHGANFREVVVPAQATFGTYATHPSLFVYRSLPPFCRMFVLVMKRQRRNWVLDLGRSTDSLVDFILIISQHDSSVRSPSY